METVDNEDIINRIYLLADSKNISLKAFEKSVGLTEGLLKSLKQKKSSIGSDKLVKIIHHFKEINSHWLLTGEGEMLKNNTSNIVQEESPTQYITKLTPIEGKSIMPISLQTKTAEVLPMSAMAGVGKEISDEMRKLVAEVKLVPHLSFRPQLIISIEGDSMQPLINEGDTVIITPSLPDETVDNKIYVIHTVEGKTLIKRVAVDKKRRLFTLMSENPYYGTMTLDEPEITALYRVIGKITML